MSALLDVFHQVDLEPVSGDGVFITSRDGRRYLDFYGGHAVALLGYAHPRLLRVLEGQARQLFFQSNLFDLEVRRLAAERLVALCPPGLTRAFFVNSGAEANENALRAAFLATRRRRVVAIAGGFHGRSAAASAATDGSASWYAFPATPFAVTQVPFDDVSALEAAIDTDVAAVILEPVQGLAGARPVSAAFMQAARSMTRRAEALLILDEVQCGAGRSGAPFAASVYRVEPDIPTAAKCLAGGFPVGAMVVREEIAATIRGDLGTTFGGGPMACALVAEVLAVLVEDDLCARVRRLSARMREECRVGPVTAVRGMGFLLGLATSRPAKEVLAELRERGILAGGSNDPRCVRLLPPLILQDAHVDRLVAALKEIGG
ncbi:MAG: aminotransferase class III-fold pyridoxal phosphate-dependent enzyme [Acidobacteriota bacterium]